MKTFENIKTLDDLSIILKIPKKKLTYILYIKNQIIHTNLLKYLKKWWRKNNKYPFY